MIAVDNSEYNTTKRRIDFLQRFVRKVEKKLFLFYPPDTFVNFLKQSFFSKATIFFKNNQCHTTTNCHKTPEYNKHVCVFHKNVTHINGEFKLFKLFFSKHLTQCAKLTTAQNARFRQLQKYFLSIPSESIVTPQNGVENIVWGKEVQNRRALSKNGTRQMSVIIWSNATTSQ